MLAFKFDDFVEIYGTCGPLDGIFGRVVGLGDRTAFMDTFIVRLERRRVSWCYTTKPADTGYQVVRDEYTFDSICIPENNLRIPNSW